MVVIGPRTGFPTPPPYPLMAGPLTPLLHSTPTPDFFMNRYYCRHHCHVFIRRRSSTLRGEYPLLRNPGWLQTNRLVSKNGETVMQQWHFSNCIAEWLLLVLTEKIENRKGPEKNKISSEGDLFLCYFFLVFYDAGANGP